MSSQLLMRRGFGVEDKPRCLSCGKPTSLTRRAPAGQRAFDCEQQTFTCFECEREFKRVVDSTGRRVRTSISVNQPGALDW
jgi:hypothetical protein